MDAIRKQATKIREQVAKQQQAVLKQFGGYGGSDSVLTDEAELQQHQKLEKLFISTRAGKHFQRDVVRSVEGYIVTGSKQVEIGSKLSEDSRKYGADNTCTSGNTLSKAALSYGRARAQMEKERGNLLKALGTQVAEPLRAMVMGTPLEDARHLAQRYDRIRQEAESQSNMAVLGKEAVVAMASVESQQQRLTLQRLIAMVESECTFHQRVLQILDQLVDEAVFSYQAESDVELNLSIGDYVVIRKVSNNGWAEGECRGKAGWFPFGYVERRERVLASKMTAVVF
ncbi:hypothetical protein IFM89_012664 [Coptis chinensis]|uniref:SH3 domain-containing protein n=1 Tax=Coptis chinensis TaxID=261450 RepID=A0A835H4Q7_9MAGN|nr:hypothetical protein IFM89_012664 [Coptis chinensis]